MWPNEPVEQWLTEQGVARNLAKNLRRRQIQDCRVRVWCNPVPAGGASEARVKTTARASAFAAGADCGSTTICKGVSHAVATAVGLGVGAGCDDGAAAISDCLVSTRGNGLRFGGGRIRSRAASRVSPMGCEAQGGSDVEASASGVKNPTDEQLMAMALLAIRRRRLTTPTPRV
jgi:hypothetical protein